MTAKEIMEKDSQFLMHTYGRFEVVLDHGEGAALWDVNGKKYIDMNSGIGVSCLGHNNEALISAIGDQAKKLIHVSNLYYTEPMTEAAELLIKAAGMGRVFFANSGAEANEGAIKLARKYAHDKYGDKRSGIVTLKQSFHGRTITTLKATGQEKFHQHFFPFTEGFVYAEAGNLEDVKAKAKDGCCAVLLEMIQGEGGVLPLDPEFVKGVEAFCKEEDLLLIVDEVQTGIGRTGTMFCFEQYGIHPNVVTAAKGLGGGLPIGAVLADASCADVLGPGSHGSTFGANPLCCAAAKAVLMEVNRPEFLTAVKEKGEYIKAAVKSMNSPLVKDVRGMGLMIGIAVPESERGRLVGEMIEKGVLVLTAGADTIRLLPPLVITKEEIDEALGVMKEVLTK